MKRVARSPEGSRYWNPIGIKRINSSAHDKRNRKNLEIRVPRVRVIGLDGEMVGVLTRDEAIALAEESGVDLVEIQPTAAKKKQKIVEIKELKFRPTTDDGDYNIKLRNLRRFLEEGDKVKVNIRFKGREMAHQELGLEMAKRIEADLGEDVVVEQRPRLEGRQMIMMVAPKKK